MSEDEQLESDAADEAGETPELQYGHLKRGGVKWDHHPDFPLEQALPIVDSLRAGVPPDSARLIQTAKGRSVWMVNDFPEAGKHMVVKLYAKRKPHDAFTYMIRETKAEMEWFFGTAFPEYDIGAPQAYACGVKHRFGLWEHACFIMEGLDPVRTFLDYLENPDEHAHAVIREIAVSVAKMHMAGVLYRDLHGNNILIQDRDEGAPRVAFIDTHQAANTGLVVPDIFCMRDLAKLNNFSNTAHRLRWRFLVAYLRERKKLNRDTLHLWTDRVNQLSQEWWIEHEAETGENLRPY